MRGPDPIAEPAMNGDLVTLDNLDEHVRDGPARTI
jgi:hypothetical protein